MTPQSVDLVGCSASNFAGSAKRWHPWAEFLDHMGMRPAAPAGRRGNGAHLTLPRHAVPRAGRVPVVCGAWVETAWVRQSTHRNFPVLRFFQESRIYSSTSLLTLRSLGSQGPSI